MFVRANLRLLPRIRGRDLSIRTFRHGVISVTCFSVRGLRVISEIVGAELRGEGVHVRGALVIDQRVARSEHAKFSASATRRVCGSFSTISRRSRTTQFALSPPRRGRLVCLFATVSVDKEAETRSR